MDNELQISQTSDKKSLYLEYALFLILGFLLGIVIKTEAGKRITIGYNDYQVTSARAIYNINDIQKKMNADKNNQQAGQEEAQNQNNSQDQNQPNNQPATEGAETSR